MWFIDATIQGLTLTADVWIEVTESQEKFLGHLEDYADDVFDPHRLTFEVLDWCRKPCASSLYIDYLPILEDRGPSREVLSKYVKQRLNEETTSFDVAAQDNSTLLKWIDDNCPMSVGAAGSNVKMEGVMPISSASKATNLLMVSDPDRNATFNAHHV